MDVRTYKYGVLGLSFTCTAFRAVDAFSESVESSSNGWRGFTSGAESIFLLLSSLVSLSLCLFLFKCPSIKRRGSRKAHSPPVVSQVPLGNTFEEVLLYLFALTPLSNL